jgi:hypothetical protein
MKPVCVKCQAAFEVKRLGVTVIETAGIPPEPFRLWRADLYACPICGYEALTQFAHEPIAQKSDSDFQAALDLARRGDRFVIYSPEALAMSIRYETKEVRPYAN